MAEIYPCTDLERNSRDLKNVGHPTAAVPRSQSYWLGNAGRRYGVRIYVGQADERRAVLLPEVPDSPYGWLMVFQPDISNRWDVLRHAAEVIEMCRLRGELPLQSAHCEEGGAR